MRLHLCANSLPVCEPREGFITAALWPCARCSAICCQAAFTSCVSFRITVVVVFPILRFPCQRAGRPTYRVVREHYVGRAQEMWARAVKPNTVLRTEGEAHTRRGGLPVTDSCQSVF